MGARITGIAFDYRRVTGAVDIEATLDEVIRRAGGDRGFVRRLATTALESGPPVGRHRDIALGTVASTEGGSMSSTRGSRRETSRACTRSSPDSRGTGRRSGCAAQRPRA